MYVNEKVGVSGEDKIGDLYRGESGGGIWRIKWEMYMKDKFEIHGEG